MNHDNIALPEDRDRDVTEARRRPTTWCSITAFCVYMVLMNRGRNAKSEMESEVESEVPSLTKLTCDRSPYTSSATTAAVATATATITHFFDMYSERSLGMGAHCFQSGRVVGNSHLVMRIDFRPSVRKIRTATATSACDIYSRLQVFSDGVACSLSSADIMSTYADDGCPRLRELMSRIHVRSQTPRMFVSSCVLSLSVFPIVGSDTVGVSIRSCTLCSFRFDIIWIVVDRSCR